MLLSISDQNFIFGGSPTLGEINEERNRAQYIKEEGSEIGSALEWFLDLNWEKQELYEAILNFRENLMSFQLSLKQI